MFKIHTKANRLIPANEFSVSGENIKMNDFMLPAEIDVTCRYNPNGTKLYTFGHLFGTVGCVFAGNDQEALENACNLGMLDFCLSDVQDYDDENLTPLGNASELFDLNDLWLAEVDFKVDRDIKLILALVRASENQADDLSDYA